MPTVRGTLGAAFNHAANGALQLALRVPGNTRAEPSIPVLEGTTELYVNQRRYAVVPQNGYATLPALGAGCHVISAEPDGQAHRDPMLVGICAAAAVSEPRRASGPRTAAVPRGVGDNAPEVVPGFEAQSEAKQ